MLDKKGIERLRVIYNNVRLLLQWACNSLNETIKDLVDTQYQCPQLPLNTAALLNNTAEKPGSHVGNAETGDTL